MLRESLCGWGSPFLECWGNRWTDCEFYLCHPLSRVAKCPVMGELTCSIIPSPSSCAHSAVPGLKFLFFTGSDGFSATDTGSQPPSLRCVCLHMLYTTMCRCVFQLMPEFTSGFLSSAQGSLRTNVRVSHCTASRFFFSCCCLVLQRLQRQFVHRGWDCSLSRTYFILFYSEPSSKNNWLCTSSNQSVDLLCKPASIAPLLSHHCSGELSISWECSCMLRFSPRGLSLKTWLVAC